MRTPPALEFRRVGRRWRAGILGASAEVHALEGCSFSLRAGEILAITGPAGAGKTTCLMLAAARVPPTAGEIRWLGGAAAEAARPQLLGARPWEYSFLTVRQALAFHADVLALRDASYHAPSRFIPVMRRVGLRGLSRTRLGALGALDQLRVVLAQALLARPLLLCLDEPFAHCGPAERVEGVAALRRLADEGLTIVVAGRDAEACGGQGTADRVLRLEAGRMQAARAARQTVLELAVPSPDDAVSRLLRRIPSVGRRGRRLRIPLRGTSPEAVLALCRDAGVEVRASRVAEERVATRRVHSHPAENDR